MNRCTLWVPLAAVLFAPGLTSCRGTSATEETRPAAKTADSKTAEKTPPAAAPARTPGDEKAASWLELTGVARAARTSPLSPKVGGILRTIKIREGQRVSAGQLLGLLDQTDIALRSEQAEVGMAQANEALKNAKNDLARAEQLHDAQAINNTAFEKAELGLRLATLQAQAAEVGLRMAKQAMNDTSLRAPFDGVVFKVLAEEGQMIPTMPPTIVFVVVDTDTLEVRVPVPERMLASIQVGLKAEVHLPAVNVTRKAKVDRIAEVIDSATRSAEAILRIDNRDRVLPAGLFARVRFPTLPADGLASAGESGR